jgi:hypothetical protein
MVNTTTVKLTDKQQTWLEHTKTAEAQGKSLSQLEIYLRGTTKVDLP